MMKPSINTATTCSLLFILILFSTLSPNENNNSRGNRRKLLLQNPSSSNAAVADACKETLYPTLCESTLVTKAAITKTTAVKNSPDKKNLFDMSVESAADRAVSVRSALLKKYYNSSMHTTISSSALLSHSSGGKKRPKVVIDDCLELLDITVDQLTDVSKSSDDGDIRTWLSAALTNQVTCMEGLGAMSPMSTTSTSSSSDGQDFIELMQMISNSLALHKSAAAADGGSTHRKLLEASNDDIYPSWVSAKDRKLLEASVEELEPHAIVAADGSGTHRSIGEALAAVMASSRSGGGGGGRSVIYVKTGTYKENINVPKKQKNVMLVGDGKGKSVIVGSKSVDSGYSTYSSATVAAMGSGFIAKGLTIINNAGPSSHQAVALRVGGDMSVVTQCSLQGYQDTLYTHSNRQFYRDNDIYGTVDFIFGDSAAVFQNCFIQPIKPNSGQKNSVTAQGRTDPNQNTGISIHNCKIIGSSNLGGTPTYLGRPWHQYARVVVMESYLDGSINSDGWEQWSGSFALSTLYYGEYGNTGPGASISGRVRWPGVHPSMSTAEASKFTVANFIYGNSWLPATGVTYTAGL